VKDSHEVQEDQRSLLPYLESQSTSWCRWCRSPFECLRNKCNVSGIRAPQPVPVPLRELSSMCPICQRWILYYGNKRRTEAETSTTTNRTLLLPTYNLCAPNVILCFLILLRSLIEVYVRTLRYVPHIFYCNVLISFLYGAHILLGFLLSLFFQYENTY